MLAANTVQHIDQLLNELEEAARGDISSVKFFASLTERMRYVLGASGAMFLMPTSSRGLLNIAQSGDVHEDIPSAFLSKWQSNRTNSPFAFSDQIDNQFWYAVLLRQSHFEKGSLLVAFNHRPADDAAAGMFELLTAFAEVAALRQLVDVERFLDNRWQTLQTACVQISNSVSLSDAAVVLVNHLVPVLGAARISLVHQTALRGTQLAAISGIPAVDSRLPVSAVLTTLARGVLRSHETVMRQHPIEVSPDGSPVSNTDSDGLFHNLVSTELSTRIDGVADANSALVIEWRSQEALIAAAPILCHVLPIISSAWNQHRRWLRVPRAIRSLCNAIPTAPHRLVRATRWAVAASLCLLAYWYLTADYPLMIEAPATLEPLTKRSVFSSADGFVEELLIADGQTVKAGQELVRLRSPNLELQMEELRGQLRTLAEKRSGLRVALNQINTSARDAQSSQGRLAAEIAQINSQESNIEQQLALLNAERDKLQLLAPIDGVIVARDLKQQLEKRPVRRGDALLTVVDLSGPWQLKVEVADRDSGYVRNALMADHSDDPIDFVFDSLPEKRFSAKVVWISNTIENRSGEGCFLEVRALVDRETVDQSHMGAGARVFVSCGQQPMWFVWCRPLVEAAQRKLWLKSENEKQLATQP